MSQRMAFSMILPLLSALCIAIYAGGLGVIFMLLFGEVEEHHEGEEVTSAVIGAGELNVVILGMIITIGVPLIAYIIQKRFNE